MENNKKRVRKVAYIFTGGRKDRLELIKQKKSPDDFLYGYNYLVSQGYDVEMIEEKSDLEEVKLPKIIKIIFQKASSYLGFSLLLFLKLNKKQILNKLNTFDVIIATTNTQGVVLGMLSKFKKIKVPIVFISMGAIPLDINWFYKKFYRYFLKDLNLSALSKDESEYIKKILGVNRVTYIPFGVDKDFWVPISEKDRKDYFLSIGNDANRDYQTLLKSWTNELPELKIITKHKMLSEAENVTIIHGDWQKQALTDEDILHYIQKAKAVIIPLKQTIQPSGQSVCMQAMACGIPVIITNVKGLWERSIMRDKFNCLLVSPYQDKEIRQACIDLLNNNSLSQVIIEESRKTILEHFTSIHTGKVIENIICEI